MRVFICIYIYIFIYGFIIDDARFPYIKFYYNRGEGEIISPSVVPKWITQGCVPRHLDIQDGVDEFSGILVKRPGYQLAGEVEVDFIAWR